MGRSLDLEDNKYYQHKLTGSKMEEMKEQKRREGKSWF